LKEKNMARPPSFRFSRYPLFPTLSVVFALLGAAVWSGDGTPPGDFTKKAATPPPQKGPFQPNSPGRIINVRRPSAADTKKACGHMQWAIDNAQEPQHVPLWRIRLAESLFDLNMDAAAFQEFRRVLDLPDNAQAVGVRLPEAKRQARLARAVLLARHPEARANDTPVRAELAMVAPETAFDRVRVAEALAWLGDTDGVAALLPQLRDNSGHPEANWGRAFIALRAATLARGLGLDAEIPALVDDLVARGKDIEPQLQWKSTWGLLEHFRRNAAAKPVPAIDALADGVYSGKANGFDVPVTVRVTVRSGRITNVTASARGESRPFSALEAMPARIVKRQGLAVDVVTGATVTSAAVVLAVDDALSAAKPKAGK
jgi:uncharacterized protein with FMN-binding domain